MTSTKKITKIGYRLAVVAMLALLWTSTVIAQVGPGATGTSGTKADSGSGGGMMNGMGGMMGGSSGSPAAGMNGMNQGAAPSPGENDTSHTKMMGKTSSRKGCCMKHMQGMMSGGSSGMGSMGGMMGGSASAPPSGSEGSGSH